MVAIWVPIGTFLLGFGSGVMTTYLLFKDHEVRITKIELTQGLYDERIKTLEIRQTVVRNVLKDKIHTEIQ